jgi:predicted RNA-binding protein with PIN domain
VPPRLRPVIRFTRLNAPALEAARRAVDEDDAFRDRVATAVDEAQVGRGAWLWLTRPDGWADEVDRLVAEREGADADADLSRRLQQARRDVEAADVARRRAEEVRDAAQGDAARARAELDAERRSRRAAEQRAASLELALADAGASTEELRAEVARLGADVEAARSELQRRADEVADLKERLAAADLRAARPVERIDLAGLSSTVEQARRAADEAAAALAGAVADLDAVAQAAGRPAPPARRGGPRGRRRTAVRLPPPLVDNTPEAVLHLLRLPACTLLVDGYNISMAAWPGTPLSEQRDRLVDALDALHARYGTEIVVVFDGDTGGRRASGPLGRAIKALFTEAGEIADDRIVSLVSATPGPAPVLVVTSDRELKDRVRSAGANVATARPFLSVLLR